MNTMYVGNETYIITLSSGKEITLTEVEIEELKDSDLFNNRHAKESNVNKLKIILEENNE